MGHHVRLAACLLVAAGSVSAAALCEGDCSVAIDFPAGGSISATEGATLTFGPAGSLAVGTGGSITLGEGGSITPAPAEGASPDMSGGGSIVLGPGGAIQFGESGALATGDQGGISAPGGVFEVRSAKTVAISNDAAVHLGDLTSHGNIELTADGPVNGCDTTTPMHFSMITDDASTSLAVTAGEVLSLGTLKGNPTVTVNTQSDITLCSEGAFYPPEGGGSSGGDESSGVYVCSYDSCEWTTTSGSDPNYSAGLSSADFSAYRVSPGFVRRSDRGGGALDPRALLMLGLLARIRRRR